MPDFQQVICVNVEVVFKIVFVLLISIITHEIVSPLIVITGLLFISVKVFAIVGLSLFNEPSPICHEESNDAFHS